MRICSFTVQEVIGWQVDGDAAVGTANDRVLAGCDESPRGKIEVLAIICCNEAAGFFELVVRHCASPGFLSGTLGRVMADVQGSEFLHAVPV